MASSPSLTSRIVKKSSNCRKNSARRYRRGFHHDYYREGASPAEQTSVMADHRSTLPGYFSAVGASLLEGRDFTDADDAQHQHVPIIDDVLAQQLWPGQSAIGRKINLSDSPQGFYQFQRDWAITVGVVRHVQYHSLTAIIRPQIYVPYPLAPRPSMSFVLHTSGSDGGLADAVRNAVDAVSRDIPVTHVEPMQFLVDRAHSESRFASLLATLLSVIALVLATRGKYGEGHQTYRGQAEICAVAASLGSVAQLCLGGTLPSPGQRLRATGSAPCRAPLPCLRNPYARKPGSTTHAKFITGASGERGETGE